MTSTCVHYWLIDEANGRWSRGVCCLCHEQRRFLNVSPERGDYLPDWYKERGMKVAAGVARRVRPPVAKLPPSNQPRRRLPRLPIPPGMA